MHCYSGAFGGGVFNLRASGETWRYGRSGHDTTPGPGRFVSFALVPSAPYVETLQLSRSGTTLIVELHLPTDRPGLALRCRITTGSQELSRHRRHVHQSANHRSSALAIAGMTLL